MFNKTHIQNKERKNILFILFRVFFWSIIILWFLFYMLNQKYLNLKEQIIINETKTIKIEKWDTFQSLSNKLEINDIFLKYYLKNNKPNYKLKTWNYKLKKDSNIWWIIESLNTPLTSEKNITILEWWNIYDIDEVLTLEWYIKKWEYIKYVTNEEKIQKLSKFFPFLNNKKNLKLIDNSWTISTLEWFLYPDTYKINPLDFKINIFVIKQLETFETKVFNKLLKPRNLTNEQILDLINLSSIVEKEEKNTKNKPIVAWILKKRLNEWWMIWADITVCYPYKLTSEECKMVISKYINDKNDYNTRTMVGLPKTPIWNPNYETIDATLNDKDSLYYYYLHDSKTWQIYYWKTNTEHENNKSIYLR